MAGTLIDRFRRWFDYEINAHAKTFASFETVPAEKRTSPEYLKAVSVMAHIIAARRIWLYRLGKIATPPASLFGETRELDDVKADWQEVQGHWSGYLAELDDDAIEQVLNYTSFDGGKFRNEVEDILAQLYGHSWYHRGQIAMLIRAAGGTPAITDFIYFCREPITDQ